MTRPLPPSPKMFGAEEEKRIANKSHLVIYYRCYICYIYTHFDVCYFYSLNPAMYSSNHSVASSDPSQSSCFLLGNSLSTPDNGKQADAEEEDADVDPIWPSLLLWSSLVLLNGNRLERRTSLLLPLPFPTLLLLLLASQLLQAIRCRVLAESAHERCQDGG